MAAAVFALAMAAYVADLAAHPGRLLAWYDLNVYNHAGLIARNFPARLYTWQLKPGISWNLFVLAGLVMFGFAAGVAVRAWLGRPAAPGAELREP